MSPSRVTAAILPSPTGTRFGRPEGRPITLPLCGLASGTMVDTPRGPSPVERLRPGSLVSSADGGTLRLHDILRLDGGPDDTTALRIRADAFGTGTPRNDVCLAAGQQLRLRGWAVEDLCGTEEVILSIQQLSDGLAVAPVACPAPARFHALVTLRPGFVLAEGLALATAGTDATMQARAEAPPQLEALLPYLARLASSLPG